MADNFDITLDDTVIETAFTELGSHSELSFEEPPKKEGLGRKQIIVLVSIGAAVLLGLIGLIVGLVLFSGRSTDDGLILDNVFAAGVDNGCQRRDYMNATDHGSIQTTANDVDIDSGTGNKFFYWKFHSGWLDEITVQPRSLGSKGSPPSTVRPLI